MNRLWKHARAVLFWAGPFALPGLAFVYVYRFYDNLPARFPIRWSADGHAELWTDKNVQEALFGPVAGWCMLTFAILAELLLLACIRAEPPSESAPGVMDGRLRRLRLLGWMNWALGAVFAVVAILPGLAHEDLQLPAWFLAAAVFACAVVAVFRTLKIKSL
jgi:uncharacterized membrane protein